MHLNSNIKKLDQSLSIYISANDPQRKSATSTVFMKKKQLFSFYGNMQSKLKQDIRIRQKQNHTEDVDLNKVLVQQEKRKRQKLYHRTFYIKKQSSNTIRLDDKKTININLNPIISNPLTMLKKEQKDQKPQQNTTKNEQSLQNRSYKNSSKLQCEKFKSLSLNSQHKNQSKIKQKLIKTSSTLFTKFKTSNSNSKIKRSSTFSKTNYQNKGQTNVLLQQKRYELLELYQRLYIKFREQKDQNQRQRLKIQRNKSHRSGFIVNKYASKSLKKTKFSKNTQIKIKY